MLEQLVVDLLDLVVVQANLDRLLGGAGGGGVGHAVDALKRGNNGVLDEARGLVDVMVVVGDGQVHARHHVHADFHQVRRAGALGQA